MGGAPQPPIPWPPPPRAGAALPPPRPFPLAAPPGGPPSRSPGHGRPHGRAWGRTPPPGSPGPRAEALVTGDEIGAPRPISVLAAGGFRVCRCGLGRCPGLSGLRRRSLSGSALGATAGARRVGGPALGALGCAARQRLGLPGGGTRPEALGARQPPSSRSPGCSRSSSRRNWPCGPPGRLERVRGPRGYNDCGSVAHGATTIAGRWPPGLQRLRVRGPRGYNDCGSVAHGVPSVMRRWS
jgi:hypothetical protein